MGLADRRTGAPAHQRVAAVRRVKLGVVTTSYPRTPGDPAGSFVAAHVEALRALGHEVEVIAAGPAAARRSPPVPVTWIPGALFDHGGAPDRLERHPVRSVAAAALFSTRMTIAVTRRARRWDAIIAHWLVPSAIAALPSRVPVLAIAHGGDIHTLRRVRLLAPVLHALHRRDVQLVFVSEPLRAIARDAAPRLAAWLETARIQPMGLDLARFRRVRHTPTRPPTLVVAARLVDLKGVDVAIDALAHLRAPVRLVIAGDGPERQRLEAHARGLASNASAIEFVGVVDGVGRDALLRQASVVVVPSRVTPSGRTEGMPMIALEALAAGVPVVASAVGGLSGLAPAAVLVQPDRPLELAAAIDRTLSEPPDAAVLRAAVADLDWGSVAPRLVRST